jgi:hypothetical protein
MGGGDEDLEYLWTEIAWWRARAIDGPLLLTLIAKFEPNHTHGPNFAQAYPNSEVIDRVEYERNVVRLCTGAKVRCPTPLPLSPAH